MFDIDRSADILLEHFSTAGKRRSRDAIAPGKGVRIC